MVVVMVHNDVFGVPVFEKIVPDGGVVSERVMEDKFGLRSISLNLLSDFPVEVLEDNEICKPPWLIDWFEGIECAVGTISLEEVKGHIETSLDVGVVHILVVSTIVVSGSRFVGPVEITQPSGSSVTPVAKASLISPDKEIGLTRVVEAVLGALGGVDVN